MNWAARRRLIILLIIGAIIVAFFAVLSISIFYKAPSCSDGVQNQEEAGVDCGGPCAYLCQEGQRPPTVLFTKALQTSVGHTDVIASVENANAAAAKGVPYSVVLYGANSLFIQEVTGTIDLPPMSKVPVYVVGIPSGKQKVVRAFLTIEPTAPKWFVLNDDARSQLSVTNTTLGGTEDAPRVDATVTNAGVAAFDTVQVVVLVHDTKGDVIAASQTIVPLVPAQGQATATFTWNSAFPSAPATIEVVPVLPLP
ncbi:MAG: hypothetical protein WCT45_03155 [Candidatus Paceibacterota bacterium]|jgi:hypothetical protein